MASSAECYHGVVAAVVVSEMQVHETSAIAAVPRVIAVVVDWSAIGSTEAIVEVVEAVVVLIGR